MDLKIEPAPEPFGNLTIPSDVRGGTASPAGGRWTAHPGSAADQGAASTKENRESCMAMLAGRGLMRRTSLRPVATIRPQQRTFVYVSRPSPGREPATAKSAVLEPDSAWACAGGSDPSRPATIRSGISLAKSTVWSGRACCLSSVWEPQRRQGRLSVGAAAMRQPVLWSPRPPTKQAARSRHSRNMPGISRSPWLRQLYILLRVGFRT